MSPFTIHLTNNGLYGTIPTANMFGYHLLAQLLVSYVGLSVQHGFLSWPPQRSSLWRHGHDSPINYNDNALWCGGLPYFKEVGEKCGTCGDSYYGPHDHEAGGKYGLGIIGVRYPMDTTSIKVIVTINAYHRGFFEFKICPHNNPLSPVQQECLDQYPLKIREAKKDSDGFKYFPPKGGEIELTVELPKGIRCSQCVLQWKYKTGNSWGQDRDGNSCLGCGPQEQFQNCADISIGYEAPSEEKTIGFTKRSVTVQEEHTKRPTLSIGMVSPEQMMKSKDANTNTLSPSGQYVVHTQSVITSTPELPRPPPKVPTKIDVSAVTLTDQLQQLLSRQTLSLTNPPLPPLHMSQWTTKMPSNIQPPSISPEEKKGSLSSSNQLKRKEPTTIVENRQRKKDPSKRRFKWKQVEVRTTKNLETHGKHRVGMVISKPDPSEIKPTLPTSVPRTIKDANMLLLSLTDQKTKPKSHMRSSGVRRSRTKPVKMTRKQKKRAERLARKQRKEAERLAKKAARLARRRNSKAESSRRRNVRKSSRRRRKYEKSQVPPSTPPPSKIVVSARMSPAHNKKPESKGRSQKVSRPDSTVSSRITVQSNAISAKTKTTGVIPRKHSVSTTKHNQKQSLDVSTHSLSSASSTTVSSNKPGTIDSKTTSSSRSSKSRSSRRRYNIPRTTLNDRKKTRRRSRSRRREHHHSRRRSRPEKSQRSSSAQKPASKPEYSKSYLELVANLKRVINQAEKVSVKPDVLKSMKRVLSDVSNGDKALAGRKYKCFTDPSSC